jgi:hypothetical protein
MIVEGATETMAPDKNLDKDRLDQAVTWSKLSWTVLRRALTRPMLSPDKSTNVNRTTAEAHYFWAPPHSD